MTQKTETTEKTEKTAKTATEKKQKAAPAAEVAESITGIDYSFAGDSETSSPVALLSDIVMPDFDSRAVEAEPDEPFLADVKAHGVISPVTVAALDDGKWLLVAGRRRFKAAKAAGLKSIPIAPRILKDGADGLSKKEQALVICLAENLHRQDMNAWDLAVQFRRFKELGWSQTQIAKSVHRKDAFVSQYLGMFELDKRTQNVIRNNAATEGVISKARLLKQIKDPDQQVEVAKECFSKTTPWTVTQLNDVVESIKLKEEERARKEAERAAAKERGEKRPRKAAAAEGEEETDEEEEVVESEFEKASPALKLAEQRALADLIKARFEKVRAKFAEAPNAKEKAAVAEKLAYEKGCFDTMKQIFGLKAAPKSVVGSAAESDAE